MIDVSFAAEHTVIKCIKHVEQGWTCSGLGIDSDLTKVAAALHLIMSGSSSSYSKSLSVLIRCGLCY